MRGPVSYNVRIRNADECDIEDRGERSATCRTTATSTAAATQPTARKPLQIKLKEEEGMITLSEDRITPDTAIADEVRREGHIANY